MMKVYEADSAVEGRRRVTAKSRPFRPKLEGSPYYGLDPTDWVDVTRDLIRQHPLNSEDLVRTVRDSWNAIFESSLGMDFKIGLHIFPRPQVMGFFLHELVPLQLEAVEAGVWRTDRAPGDKDIVYIPNEQYSIELKTSSHPVQIFANRSYGQEAATEGKKAKDGYYLAVNFESWPEIPAGLIETQIRPAIRTVRFGWLDHSDWLAQLAATGQQSNLPALVENKQLLVIGEHI